MASKYLLICIDGVADKFVEAVVVEALKFEDDRGLKIQRIPKIVWFAEMNFTDTHRFHSGEGRPATPLDQSVAGKPTKEQDT